MGADTEHCCWLIEPLVSAGMDVEQIRTLVTRLACDASGVEQHVDDQRPEVRAAWTEMIGRMLERRSPSTTRT